MKFIKSPPDVHQFDSAKVQVESAHFIAHYLSDELSRNSVLLLLSGGSALPMYLIMFKYLIEKTPDLSKLTVSLLDERFVLRSSPDSNEQQLQHIGLMDLLKKHEARWIHYLDDANRSGIEVARKVSTQFETELSSGKKLIILAGVGEDGHTAGLLPTTNSIIIKDVFESEELIEYYELSDDIINHFRQRLTATPKLIEKADQIIVYAIGESKKKALKRLLKNAEFISDCPCVVLLYPQNPPILLTDQDVE